MAIPSNLANIKYSGIKGSSGGISQVAADKSYASFNAHNQANFNSMMNSIDAASERILNEKKSQKALDKTNSNYMEKELLQVVGLNDTGNSTFDDNKQNYFYDLKARYVQIKNYMDENPDKQAAGAKELAKIKQQVQVFKDASPIMVGAMDQIRKSLEIPQGQPGAMSSGVPSDVQTMLLALQGGGPEVSIVNGEDGNLVLFMGPQKYMENGEEKTTEGAQFNLNKFLELQRNGGEFFQTIPDWKPELKEIADDVIKTSNGKDNPLYYTLNEISVGDNKNAVVKEWNSQIIDPATRKPMIGGEFLDVMGQQVPNPFKGQKINGEMLAQMDLIRTGAFNSLLKPQHANDNDASILWTDVIGTDRNGNPGQDSVWDVTNKNQLSTALNWLSKQAVNEFGIEEGVLSHQNKPKPTSDGLSSGSQNAMDIYNDLAGLTKSNVSSYFKNKKINGKDVLLDGVKLVDKVNDYGEVVAKDALLTIEVASGKTDEDGNRTANSRPYDLTNPVEFETLINDVVGYEHSIKGGAKAKAIRDSIKKSIAEMTNSNGRDQTYNN